MTSPLPPAGAGTVRTTCAYCGVGCGVLATPTGARTATIAGDPDHPANAGRLCSKGTHLGETIGLEGRLLHPMIGSRRVDWDVALDLVASRFAATIAEHGPDSVAFYASGQMLTEDYYVANKWMKGFVGTANIDTNSRLCMASAVAAHVRAFGEDVVPCGYDDLDAADLIVLVGSNTAWCHPVVWQRIEAARARRGTKLVVIDPRRTETAERADLHLAIAPDSDVALFTGLLGHMRTTWRLDGRALAERVAVPEGFWKSLPTADVARTCDISPADLDAFYDLFAERPRTITLFSQGVNQSTSGTDKANAIINLHLATGRIGKSGAGPFSITGQPNAMGGREVGGLASTLAAHMGFSAAERDRARRFWRAPTICAGPGLKAVDMFDAMAKGRIKAVWIMATNPAVSMPDARMARVALANCPFVVVSDCIADTDTLRYAQVKLPALGWGEKDGTVTNSERRVSRQRAFLAAPGEARADWWAVAAVARRMGFAGFDYANAASIFREFAAQTGFENGGTRLLDISDRAAITDAAYAEMAPFQWGGASPFATRAFTTPDGRARLVPVAHEPRDDATRGYPLRLNTGRYRDQWHTMTRTGLSTRLSQHRREPLVEVHPDTARRLGLGDGGLARVETPHGASIFRVAATTDQRRHELFVPIHWSDQTSAGGRAGLLPGANRDPHSGQPGFKNTPARARAYRPGWTGFLIARERTAPPDCAYWTRVRAAHGWLTELAGDGDPAALTGLLPPGERAEMIDARRGVIRATVVAEGCLQAALFIARGTGLPAREWLLARLGAADATAFEILAGRPVAPAPDRGAIVCACFDVGLNTLLAAITDRRLVSVEAVGAAINAGTNCGSCRPAIAKLLPKQEAAYV
ncbi:molybdopterin-dependent oxidoreductase [Sphingomonas sp. NFR15]|uniref:molybdopterin-dependent oxidoreductase n=1 Tax=Sphingomonas sp. NFR15 TaxID=1566282 RepID=UPI00088BD9C8|nr:molybdopterin-dependent oxidoreductase [Sphingomonas sp. NFR15]SDA36851.1 assimilatory nitrate reductase catalytic subunit [Sphingomonas sp. NFR15]